MKQGKRPTRKQKEAMKFAGLNTNDWLVTKSLENELHLVHRELGKEMVISFMG